MIRFLISAFLAAPSFTAAAASFTCSDGSTAIEIAICGDQTLSQADEELARLVQRARSTVPTAALDQESWVSNVRNACGDAECLANAYLARIADIERTLNDVREISPLTVKEAEASVVEPVRPSTSVPPPAPQASVVEPDPAVKKSERSETASADAIWTTQAGSCPRPSGFVEHAIYYTMMLVVIALFPVWLYLVFVWLFKFCRGYYRWRMGDPSGLSLFEFEGDQHLTRRQRRGNIWLFAFGIAVALYPVGFLLLTTIYGSIARTLLCIR